MKIRQGFVSNSSSSSFVCSICNYTESGMDAELEDFEMFRCKNGHTLHESCTNRTNGKTKLKTKDDMFKEYLMIAVEEYRKKYYDGTDEKFEVDRKEIEDELKHEYSYEVSEECCPICQFLFLTEKDELLIRRKGGKDRNELLLNLNNDFKSYEEFKKYLEKV